MATRGYDIRICLKKVFLEKIMPVIPLGEISQKMLTDRFKFARKQLPKE